jgi:mono/diheme cytochrome c family protein
VSPDARSIRWLLAAVAVAAAPVAIAACGNESADVANGKRLFTQRCGSCHVLADAGTKGVVGPDLDQAFRQSLEDGLGRDTIEGIVSEQIALPMGPEMPANLVTGADREDVSAYVADVAGKRGGGPALATGGDQSATAKADDRNQVEIPADRTGQLRFDFTSAEAKAGNVTLLSKNDSPVPHDISIKGGGVDEHGNQVTNGGTSKVSANLKPRKYTFYCSVPGHEQGGMKGTLTVR